MPPASLRPATTGVLLHELTSRIESAVGDDHGDVRVTGVTLDSRAVRPGDLYAALPGFNVHGADFAPDAVALGAVAVLTDPDGVARIGSDRDGDALGVPLVVTAHPRDVLGGLSALVYGDPAAGLTMVGVTGTNGKTTTAYLIDSALRAQAHRTGLIGTVETRIGDVRIDSVRTTPEAPDLHAILAVMRERGVDACVMEVSSHALDLHRVDGVVYDVALFTNLSQDHLDFHPSMDEYFAAKASLFTPERSRAGVVCVDDEWGVRLASEATVPVTTMSTTHADADWLVELGEGGSFTLRESDGGRLLRLTSHLPGTFNVANAALAALALLGVGLDTTQVERSMAVPPAVPGRMETVSDDGAGPRCIVDFAHTPVAVDAALRALRPSTTGRLVVVLGAGGDRDRGKRPGMGAAAARQADVVVVTDDNPRSEDPATIRAAVIAGARAEIEQSGTDRVRVIDGGSRAAAIAEAIALAVLDGAGDVDTVVVLGKGHEKGQEVAGVVHPFDDRDAVRAALAAAAGTAAGTTAGTTAEVSS